MKKKRIEYLDLLKAVSILLVVFCHYTMLPNETLAGNLIMSAAWGGVPCFFLASGGVMHRASTFRWKKYLHKLFQTYVVLVIWKVIYLLVYFRLRELTFSRGTLIRYLFFFDGMDGVDDGVLWFMYAYLFVLLVYPVTYFLFKHGKEGKTIISFLMVLLFVGSFLPTTGTFLTEVLATRMGTEILDFHFPKVFPFGTYGNMLFFFLLGAFLLEYQSQFQQYFQKNRMFIWIPVACILAGVLGLTGIKYVECGTWRWMGQYLNNGYSRIAVVVLAIGMYVLIMNWKIHPLGHWMAKYLGTSTQGIYYMHYLILGSATIILGESYMKYASLGANVIKTAVVALICMVLTLFLKKIPVIRHLVS